MRSRFIRGFAVLALLVGVVAVLTPSSDAASKGVSCRNPRFVTTNPNGMWSSRGYVVHNNMWNVGGYNVKERLAACSPSNWSVVATANNATHDGAVKTYPNVHRDFHNWNTGHEPKLSAFHTITSTFAARTPNVGIYDEAYDIWLNGVPGNREVMIWTNNFHQFPAGSRVASGVMLSGLKWRVYASSDNSIISFVPQHRLTHGTIRIKSHLDWLVRHGRVQRGSTLGQICFGFEIVSTGGHPARFKVDKFSVSTTRR
jgi:Glycosyl hydrolase family 12